ncbi:MAG: ABC-F family ATP-binding cassette domain-containing protein [Anaerolineales bacterium]|nr:ABC-F family ATP-binding cassette domain-containing protein [Anaerolineales bacterium]
MSLLSAQSLARSFGAEDIFQGVDLAVPDGARIAMVGPNGAGKTTLLRILIGEDQSDAGVVHRKRNLRIGYLPQETSFQWESGLDLDRCVYDYYLDAFLSLRQMEQRLAELTADMAAKSCSEDVITQYGNLEERFELEGGYLYPVRIRQVLRGLGFEEREYERPLKNLSGGERTRAFLGRLLLDSPDLLVLDEPTNHLDIAAIEWLESWIRGWAGAALVVSHDRFFLDRIAEAIWELTPSGINTYRGNYSAYLIQRREREELHRKAYQAQQAYIEKESDYIRRNIAGQNTRQAQGRRTRLERMLRDEKIDRPKTDSTVSIEFHAAQRSGEKVIETMDLDVGFPDDNDLLFHVPDLVLHRTERVALIGPNGAGKTTFIRTILGEHPPFQGTVQLGASLQIGYFAQAHEGLRQDLSVLDELLKGAPGMQPGEGRDYLAQFLFKGDDIYKLVGDLSGGERGRLALAKLIQEGANFLLLDEPTNHLDLPSQEVLQEALSVFPGTILLVSHDRYLVDALATQVWVVGESNGQMEVYLDGYQEYLEARSRKEEERQGKKVKTKSASREKSKGRNKQELKVLEEDIEALERKLALLSSKLEEFSQDHTLVRKHGERYAEIQHQLELKMKAWETLANEVSEP